MDNIVKNKIKGLLLADLHLGASDPEKLKQELEDHFFNEIFNELRRTGHKYDYIIILGDLWDHKLQVNDASSQLGMWFLMTLISFHITKIRFVYGTESHEVDQYQILEPIIRSLNTINVNYVDIKVIKTASEEELFPGLHVLYLPEEYVKDKDSYYNEFFSKKKYYNYIFGHGVISEVMTMTKRTKENAKEKRLKPAIFTTADFKKCCKGEVYFGHYHVHSSYGGTCYYVGSFSRWIQGEEEEKGCMRIEYDEDLNEYDHFFVENTDAPEYITYRFGYDHSFFQYSLQEALETVKNLIRNKPDAHIHLVFCLPETHENPEAWIHAIRILTVNNPLVSVDFVNGYVEKKKEQSMQEISTLVSQYSYILDKDLKDWDKISKFIEETKGKILPPEKVQKYLSTDISKLIEEELTN